MKGFTTANGIGKSLSLSLIIPIIFTGCNTFSFIDKPSGDAQLLEAARACFDKGDYDCANTNYNALSSSSADQANSEKAYLQMTEAGVDIGTFMTAVVNNSSAPGKIVTQIANAIGTNANETTRLALFHAYQNYKNVTDTRVQGLIQFVTSLVLLAELIAENASTPGNVKKSDLVSDPTTCAKATLDFSSCNKPSTGTIVTGTTSFVLSSAADTDMSGTPNLYMINAAVEAISDGLDQMQTNGSLGSSSISFSSGILSKATSGIIPGTDSPIYRKVLIEQDIGAN